MPNYQIVAVDLDGTLLDSQRNLSQENDRAIRQLTKMGVQVVAASGRALTEVDPRIHAHPDIRYIISSAGALVYDKHTGNKHTCLIDVAKTRQILDILADYDVTFCFHYDGDAYMDAADMQDRLRRYEMTEYMRDFLLSVDIPTENMFDFCQDNKAAEMFVVFFQDASQQAECKRRVDALGGVLTASSEPKNLEIAPADAGKGPALLNLARRLGVDQSATIAVGDSLNDYTMIRDAGLSLVVSNGFPELKAMADQVICSNDEHIMEYILKNIIK